MLRAPLPREAPHGRGAHPSEGGDGHTVSMNPALDRALRLCEAVHPVEAPGVVDSVRCLLQGIADSPTGVAAWSQSALSRNGFPIEFAFRSDVSEVRYTAEVAGPGIPPAERLTLAQEWTGAALPHRLYDLLTRAQSMGPLKYGVWIGGRHRGGRATYKLYVELPEESASVVSDWAAAEMGVPRLLSGRTNRLGRANRLRMVGCPVGSDGLELYFDSSGLRPAEVAMLMGPLCLESRAPEILDLLRVAYGRSIRRELPARDFGYSYALNAAGEPAAFSLYTFANALLGGDGRIRAAILRLADRVGWDAEFYERLSRPIERRTGWLTVHGLFGVTVAQGREACFTFGLVPPEEAYK